MTHATELAETWATKKDPNARVSRLGQATGLPAFVVRIGEPGTKPKQTPIVIDSETVLVGRSGWRQFIKSHGTDDPTKTAAAWLALYRGEPQEPFGSQRKYKKKSVPDPAWSGDRLTLIYAGHRGPHKAVLRLGEADTVEVISDAPWSPRPF